MPKYFQLDLSGTYYKVGLHGLVFIWLNNGWVRSAKTADEIYDAIEKGGE